MQDVPSYPGKTVTAPEPPGEKCCQCSKPVPSDVIGLNCKLINRGVREFLCLECLSAKLAVPEAGLLEMAEHFRAAGCHLFLPHK